MSCYILINYLKGENKMAHFKLNQTVNAMIEAGVLQGECHKELVGALHQDGKAKKQWKKACDSLRAVGITAAMIATEAKGGIVKLRAAVRQTCIDALPPADKALLMKDTEAVDESEKVARGEIQRTVGRNVAKIEKHMRDAESEGQPKAPRVVNTRRQQIIAALDSIIGWLAGDDDGSMVFDIPQAAKDAKALRTLVSK